MRTARAAGITSKRAGVAPALLAVELERQRHGGLDGDRGAAHAPRRAGWRTWPPL